ncbi:MAG: replication initiator protein A [Rhodospirillaceae bacterium]|nr:replication initiator protein A [Rhodospirillaceae bacterium]
MSGTESLPPLTPVRYQPTFFAIDPTTIAVKDTQQHLEHPFFSLSKTPDTATRRYEDRLGNTLTVRSIDLGVPTIWDKDVLIFAVSQIMARRNRGEKVSPTVRFHTADLLEFSNRVKGGSAYQRIDDAIRRLSGCQLETSIRTGGIETTKIFHIIDEATIKRQYNRPDGRLEYVEFTLSDWLWRAIQKHEVLTLHPDYFRLRQALARRLYEIARKHCGRKAEWEISLPLLHEKSGSKSDQREFRRMLRKLCRFGDLLDYDMELLPRGGKEIIRFCRREGALVDSTGGTDTIQLSETVIPAARRIIGSARNVNRAEKDWRRWMLRKGYRPTNAEAFFLSFCRRWAQSRGLPEEDISPDSKPSLRDELAQAWWDGLDDDARQRWQEGIGLRVELADGTGWWRSEESLAREAFDRLYPFQGVDPAHAELPQVLLDRMAGELEEHCMTGEVLAAAWRAHASADSVLRKIEDPVMSLQLFAQDVKSGKAAALQAVRRCRDPFDMIPGGDDDPPRDGYPVSTESAPPTWEGRAFRWWDQLDWEDWERALAQHRDDPSVRAALEAGGSKRELTEILMFRAYRKAHPDDPPPPDHPCLA